jgi:hypothetical protein
MTPDDFLNLGKQDDQPDITPEQAKELQEKYAANLKALKDQEAKYKRQNPDPPELPPKSEEMKLPPQVKFGIAIMELEDGSVVRMPINPNSMHVTYGMMLRMLMGEIEDVRAEILAIKVKNLTRPQPPPPGSGNGLIDLS